MAMPSESSKRSSQLSKHFADYREKSGENDQHERIYLNHPRGHPPIENKKRSSQLYRHFAKSHVSPPHEHNYESFPHINSKHEKKSSQFCGYHKRCPCEEIYENYPRGNYLKQKSCCSYCAPTKKSPEHYRCRFQDAPKPLNVHLKLQLLNARNNENKKPECLCAKYFQMLNAIRGCRLPPPLPICSNFQETRPPKNVEQIYPPISNCNCPPQQRDLRFANSKTQTDEQKPCTCEDKCDDYLNKILNTEKVNPTEETKSKEQDQSLNGITSTLSDITSTLQNIENYLNDQEKLKNKSSPTIVSFFSVPPPPLFTIPKLSVCCNASSQIQIPKEPKAHTKYEELLKLFNLRDRQSYDLKNNWIKAPNYELLQPSCATTTAHNIKETSTEL